MDQRWPLALKGAAAGRGAGWTALMAFNVGEDPASSHYGPRVKNRRPLGKLNSICEFRPDVDLHLTVKVAHATITALLFSRKSKRL